jgi:hypothetical protein
MDILATIASTVFEQMQKPTLAFLIMGVCLPPLAVNSKSQSPFTNSS